MLHRFQIQDAPVPYLPLSSGSLPGHLRNERGTLPYGRTKLEGFVAHFEPRRHDTRPVVDSSIRTPVTPLGAECLSWSFLAARQPTTRKTAGATK